MEDKDKFEKHDENEGKDRDEIFSKAVRAGKRTYFFDVKATRNDDYYLTITESKKKILPDGRAIYEKHKIFLYKEDFDKFNDSLKEVITVIQNHAVPENPVPTSHKSPDFTNVSFEDIETPRSE